jgi:hypothetical protein
VEALLQEQNVTEIPRLSDDIRTLRPTYRAHGELMRAALHDRADNTITWDLIHVLEKVEKGVK